MKQFRCFEKRWRRGWGESYHHGLHSSGLHKSLISRQREGHPWLNIKKRVVVFHLQQWRKLQFSKHSYRYVCKMQWNLICLSDFWCDCWQKYCVMDGYDDRYGIHTNEKETIALFEKMKRLESNMMSTKVLFLSML